MSVSDPRVCHTAAHFFLESKQIEYARMLKLALRLIPDFKGPKYKIKKQTLPLTT